MEATSNEEYKKIKLSPILVPLVAEILQEKPHNIVCVPSLQAKFIVDFLERTYQGIGIFSERAELEHLREERKRLEG